MDFERVKVNSSKNSYRERRKTPKNRRNSHFEMPFEGSHVNTESFHRTSSPKITQSRSRINRTEMSYHLNQLKHLQRRISEIGSINERKKMNYDLVTHPVLFFRRKNQRSPSLNKKFLQRILKKPESIKVYERVSKRSQSNFREKSVEEDVKGLEQTLLNAIVSRRLYKDDQLDSFFGKIKQHCVLSERTIELAIRNVKSTLEEN